MDNCLLGKHYQTLYGCCTVQPTLRWNTLFERWRNGRRKTEFQSSNYHARAPVLDRELWKCDDSVAHTSQPWF